MIFDARSVPNKTTLDADICIAGAGVAGITLARELINAGVRVCLLESGGLEPDRVTQSLYWGENIGLPYYSPDVSQARFFGGTSNCWHVGTGGRQLGARLHPLDPIDFEERDWVPFSGWPFAKAHLDPYYERAHAICRTGRYDYDAESWAYPERSPQLPLRKGLVKTTMFHFVRREVFFQEYREEIEKAENISAFLHANAVEIETNDTAQKVTGIKVACLNGPKFRIAAKLYILASGAMEIPRLLLISNKVQKEGLGNQHDLVGRFFMEHPHLWSGVFIPAGDHLFRATGLYRVHTVDTVPVLGKLTLSDAVLRSEKLLSYAVSIHPRLCVDPAGRTGATKGAPGITEKISRQFRGEKKIEGFALNHMSEQAPNPDSRVMLSEEKDALGQRRVNIDWRLTATDIWTIRRAQQLIDEELRHAGLGRLHIEMQDESVPPDITGGWHHMGTTRMHTDPKKGVVDANSKVHGIVNLFIAGPSVFPTCGYANPVLTTVALAARLGDHVKKNMESFGP